MGSFFDFFSFKNPGIVAVVVGSILLTSSSALVGTFTFLRKKALVGDAVAHAVLPGICLAFLLSGTKNPFFLIIGAFVTGWLSLYLIDRVTLASKIKEDTAIALTLSVFFGVGILMLTHIQHQGNASQAGLDSFLFGKAAAMVGSDLITFSIVAVILMATVGLFFKELKLIAFDMNYAKSLGLPVKTIDLLLTTLTVMAVVTGIQAVGVILMSAMLITPAAAARFWTHHVKTMCVIAALLGAFSGITGAYVSYVAPAMPTGPWIVMIISAIALLSFFFAPGKGILSKAISQRKLQHLIMDENLLKALFHLGEADHDPYKGRTGMEIIKRRHFPKKRLMASLTRLQREGFLTRQNGEWAFTEAGRIKGQRVVKLHRLWELYLSEYMKIAPDHVHEDAETIEHIITPEIEAKLEHILDYPEVDPHEEKIPY